MVFHVQEVERRGDLPLDGRISNLIDHSGVEEVHEPGLNREFISVIFS
jgi:hypothetical protein